MVLPFTSVISIHIEVFDCANYKGAEAFKKNTNEFRYLRAWIGQVIYRGDSADNSSRKDECGFFNKACASMVCL